MGNMVGSSYRRSMLLILVFLGAMFAFGAGTLLTVHAQKGGNEYFSTRTFKSNGKTYGEFIIKGPSHRPAGYEAQSAAVTLPEPGLQSSVFSLAVPAYDWVLGCSAVSGSMIASYYDRNGYPNIYTGPSNGGVMPMNNSDWWGTWTDSELISYPFNPLTASRKGFDGRLIKGTTEDYWLASDSTAPDPFIGHWTEHTWGDAIGDYMKTSQSTYNNRDGWTAFYYNPGSPAPLTCTQMETASDNGTILSSRDGTYGRKQFYQARGYTVTDCYTQLTDNQVGGGFSFNNYKAEINAGHPVMINVEGHTMVGIGYDDSSNTIYINDTWDHLTHSMTWGGSYKGMTLWSVSIVNLAPASQPAPFNTISPTDGAQSLPTTTLKWQNSAGATAYYYCLQNTAGSGNTCASSWITTNTNTSKDLSGLTVGSTYFWKVKAHNSLGDTYSNGDAWRSFTVVTSVPIYLPLVSKPGPELLNGDFEQGRFVGWTEYSSHSWAIIGDFSTVEGLPPAHSGTYGAWLGAGYNETSFIEQPVNIKASAPYLIYWYWTYYEDPCYSGFGMTLIGTDVVDNYDLCVNTGGWVKRSLNLGAYAGQTVNLQIKAITPYFSNLFVDDVYFSASAAGASADAGVPTRVDLSGLKSKSELYTP